MTIYFTPTSITTPFAFLVATGFAFSLGWMAGKLTVRVITAAVLALVQR